MSELMKIEVITDGGPWATHNYPCPVYQDLHAIINLNSGVFTPSRKAESEGWRLIQVKGWFKKWLFNLIFADDYWSKIK